MENLNQKWKSELKELKNVQRHDYREFVMNEFNNRLKLNTVNLFFLLQFTKTKIKNFINLFSIIRNKSKIKVKIKINSKLNLNPQ